MCTFTIWSSYRSCRSGNAGYLRWSLRIDGERDWRYCTCVQQSEPSSPTTGPRICCLDLDTFFVSVERILDPTLIGQPVVVGGGGGRGVVTAASYEVRSFGVRSGMPGGEARRLAPHAIFLPTRHGVYGPYAKRVRAILDTYTPAVRTASVDEFFLDFSGCERLYHHVEDATADATIERTVWAMRDQIQEEVGLPASVGVATNRPIAKIASGAAKPAGVVMVRSGGEAAFLEPLPVRKYPGIGPVTEAKLRASGIETMAQLLHLPPGPLRARFGRLSEAISNRVARCDSAAGLEQSLGADRPAFLEYDTPTTVGSISNERTFLDDVGDPGVVRKQLRKLSERVCWRARQRGLLARTISLKLRYSDFETISRSHTGSPTTCESRVYKEILALYPQSGKRRVRLVGVCLSNLVRPPPQLVLPFPGRRRPEVGSAIDKIRERFGYEAVRLGVAGEATTWQA